MAKVPFVYLASRSPRRAELLQQVGIPFQLLDTEIDESVLPDEGAADYVERLARSKAEAGWQVLKLQGGEPAPVLAADTTVAHGCQLLGKPGNEQDAIDTLMKLSGNIHDVLTGLALFDGEQMHSRVVITRVRFERFPVAQAQRYVATGEPMDKAGSYGIQGFGSALVAGIEGSYSNVVGLPLKETVELAALFDIPYWQKLSGDQ